MSTSAPPTKTRARVSRLLDAALDKAPAGIVTVVVAVALAAGITVSLGIHRPYITLPLAAAVTWALWRLQSRTGNRQHAEPAATRDERLAHAILLGGLLAWTLWGFFYASEYLIVSRDPGFLALTGAWLIDHPNTDIPSQGTVAAVSGHVNMLADAWQAWNLRGDEIQPQGAKMLPGVLAVGGWLGGITGLLWTNVVIGAGALASVYQVARRLLSPLRALVPVGILGLSVVHLALSRSPYSEPLTLILLFAAIAWAWQALESRSLGLMAAAGVASGATALVRIDGAAYALGVLVGVTAACVIVGTRRRALIAVFVGSQALAVAAGYASLWRWSEAYLERLGSEARQLGLAYAVVALITLAVIAVAPRRRASERPGGLPRISPRLAAAASIATVTVALLLASRPLWMEDHRGTTTRSDIFTNDVVEMFQQGEGYEIDPTRTYAEHTVTWLSYYLTWPVLAVATVGLGVMAYRAFKGSPATLIVLGALAVPSAIYLVRPAVVPDQIWAIRRFEPATIPVLAVAAGLGMWWLVDRTVRRFDVARGTVAGVGIAVMIGAVVSTYVSIKPGDEYPALLVPYTNTSELDGARAEIDGLCEAIDGRPVVLSGSSGHFGSIRVMCDVPVILALVPPTADDLTAFRAALGADLVVLSQDPASIGLDDAQAVVSSAVRRGEYGLQHLPRQRSVDNSQWFLGTVGADGSTTPVAPTQAP